MGEVSLDLIVEGIVLEVGEFKPLKDKNSPKNGKSKTKLVIDVKPFYERGRMVSRRDQYVWMELPKFVGHTVRICRNCFEGKEEVRDLDTGEVYRT